MWVRTVGKRRVERELAKSVSTHSNVGQVRSSGLGVVGDDDIAVLELALEEVSLELNGVLHRTQVDGDVRCVGDETSVCERGAGKSVTLHPALEDVERDVPGPKMAQEKSRRSLICKETAVR